MSMLNIKRSKKNSASVNLCSTFITDQNKSLRSPQPYISYTGIFLLFSRLYLRYLTIIISFTLFYIYLPYITILQPWNVPSVAQLLARALTSLICASQLSRIYRSYASIFLLFCPLYFSHLVTIIHLTLFYVPLTYITLLQPSDVPSVAHP